MTQVSQIIALGAPELIAQRGGLQETDMFPSNMTAYTRKRTVVCNDRKTREGREGELARVYGLTMTERV